MFIGHFGVGLAAKKFAPEVSLGFLFIACQLLDLIWPVLVLLGVERVAVDHSATEVTPLNFSHYPYSHSLVMSLIYGLIGSAMSWRLYKSARVSAVVGLTVFSHWILDFITHRPDLPFFFGVEKFGLGLWNSVLGTVAVEAGIFSVGVTLYLLSKPLLKSGKKFLYWSMIGFLSVMYIGNIWGPKAPADAPPVAIAGPALAMWLVIIWGYYADKGTRVKEAN